MNQLVTLRDVAERIDYGFTTSATVAGDGPKFLRITDIDKSHVDWNTVPTCNATSEEIAKYSLESGDIVVARTGASTGRSQWVQVQSTTVFASYLVRFRISKDFNSRFIGYVLNSSPWLDYVSSVAHGKSAQPNMSAASMADFMFECPPLTQQVAIAEVLGALDDKIAANTKLATICDNLALSTLHVCPASVPVGEIVTYKKGSIDVSTLGAPEVAHFSLPAFDSGKLPDLCNPDEIKSNKAHVQAPSVLISKLNPRFPRVWNLPKLPSEPAVASTEFLVLEPKFSSTSVLWAILSQEKFKRELETQVAGTSGSHQRVKPADLLATKVIDPRNLNSETQHLITSLCETSFHSQYENRHLEVTRDALLPQLMSGKLRVKDAEKIVEETL